MQERVGSTPCPLTRRCSRRAFGCELPGGFDRPAAERLVVRRNDMKRAICQIGAIAIGVVVCISVNMVHPDHARSSLVTHRLHMIDSSEVGVDSIPPTPPDVHVFSIKRGRGPDKSQPGQVSFSPNDKWGSIVLVVSDASDDRTQYSGLGYRIRHLKGELPE